MEKTYEETQISCAQDSAVHMFDDHMIEARLYQQQQRLFDESGQGAQADARRRKASGASETENV